MKIRVLKFILIFLWSSTALAALDYSRDAIEVNLSETTKALDSEEITPETWKMLEITLVKEDGDRLDISLLRPNWWIKKVNAYVGSTIYLDMPEMGAVGYSQVLSIKPTSADSRNSKKGYDVVTGKFTHLSDKVYDLYFEGTKDPLGVTESHPIWSNDRNGWIRAGDLNVGETVQTKEKQTVLLKKIKRYGKHRVYNLEVHKSHTFYVSELAILVHNSCFPDSKEIAKRLGTNEKTFHKQVKAEIKSDFPNEMKKINSTNPDIGISKDGNILLKNPKTGKVSDTGVPIDAYKR